MHPLCWAYKFIEIVLMVFLAYHKRHILIKCLVDLTWRIVHQEIPPLLRAINLVCFNTQRTKLRKKEMKNISYASTVGSLMYAQVYTCPNIAYVVGMIGRYLSNLGMIHWKAVKWVMWYLQRTKDFKLTYWRSDHLEIIGYSDSDFDGCIDSRRSTSEYVFMLAKGVVS